MGWGGLGEGGYFETCYFLQSRQRDLRWEINNPCVANRGIIMTLSCRLGLLCSHLFFSERVGVQSCCFFFFSWKLLREQRGVFRWSWGAFGKAGGSDNLSPERISDNSNIARYGSVYAWLLVWNLLWFWSAVLLICSVTAGPMFSNEWQKKLYFISGSFCLYTRLKNNTGALDSFFFFFTFLIFPQTRVPSMWVSVWHRHQNFVWRLVFTQKK